MTDHNTRQLMRALAEIDDLRDEISRLSAENKIANAAFEESDKACADLEDEIKRQKAINAVLLKEHQRLFDKNSRLKDVYIKLRSAFGLKEHVQSASGRVSTEQTPVSPNTAIQKACTQKCPDCENEYSGAFCPCSYEVQDDEPVGDRQNHGS